MPIENYENKVVIIAGQGDILWGPSARQRGAEVDHLIIGECEKGEVGRKMPELDGSKIDSWSVKIVLPCKKSWASLYDVLQQYAIEKWGEIPEEF